MPNNKGTQVSCHKTWSSAGTGQMERMLRYCTTIMTQKRFNGTAQKGCVQLS